MVIPMGTSLLSVD